MQLGDLDLIAAANDDRIQEPYRRRLIPDYNAVRDTCLNGGAKTICRREIGLANDMRPEIRWRLP